MPRNIIAAQKHAGDFYKSDVLAETNQIVYMTALYEHKSYFVKI